MRLRLLVLVLVVSGLALMPAVAAAGKLSGISADGTRYLEGKTRVCSPAAVDGEGQVAAPPACADEPDKQALAAWSFVSVKKLKAAKIDETGRVRLSLVIDGARLSVMGTSASGERLLAVQVFAGDVVKARGPYLAAGGALLVVEVDRKDGKKKVVETIGFDVRAGLAGLAPKAGGVVDRVLGKARTWVQAQIPCEQAGVTLELGPGDKFRITTDVKCKGYRDRLRVGGVYRGEEPATLVFTFENDDDPDEDLTCRLEACPGGAGEECVLCVDDDVTFTLAPAPDAAPAEPSPGKGKKPPPGR